MEKSNQTGKISKFVKGLKGALIRQKPVGNKEKAATLNGHAATLPQGNAKRSNARDRLPLPLLPMTDAICQLPYYHPHLTSKDDLTNFMSQYSLQEGYFLLRQSFKDPNSYTITVNHRFGLKHIRVVMSNGRFSLKDRSFETIDEMIQFYSHREIPNEENIPGILLRFPIRRPPVEFGEYIVVSNGRQGVCSTPLPDQNLRVVGKQGALDDRPQPPTPRPPATLPRSVGHYISPPIIPSLVVTEPKALRNGSVYDPIPSTLIGPPCAVDPCSSKPIGPSATIDPFPSTLIGPHSAIDPNSTKSIGLSAKNGPIPIAPTGSPSVAPSAKIDPILITPPGPPSAIDPNLSKAIGRSSTCDPILSTPIGPPAQRSAFPDRASDAFQNERCDCGLLLREAALPLGWSVHVSQDSDTKDQPFFQSPSNETHWDLPLSVALRLSSDQQDIIRNLGFDSDIKAGDAKALHPGRLMTSPMGCPPKQWEGATSTHTWVPCNDYESSKSLREALQRQHERSPCLQNAPTTRPEHTPNAEMQQTGSEGNEEDKQKDMQGDTMVDSAATFADGNEALAPSRRRSKSN